MIIRRISQLFGSQTRPAIQSLLILVDLLSIPCTQMRTRYYKQEEQQQICSSEVPCECGYSTTNHIDIRGCSKACFAWQTNPGSEGLCMNVDISLIIMQISRYFLTDLAERRS